ncbi:MAG: hypothetical protein SGI72_18535 [Planctomycetota bacterium]|nr:hypothetical protein [Planctomycetota bacterium]
MIVHGRLFSSAALVFIASCASSRDGAPEVSARYLYDDLGSATRAVTTQSSEAQRYFDQGLVLVHAFNHDEAIRSFTAASEIDPNCAAAWWGIALAHGPHINNAAMTPDASDAAWKALKKAQGTAGAASEVERALIDALSARYAWPAPLDRSALDGAYADAMRATWRRFSSDAEVGALCAESLMNLHPWDMYTNTGAPKPWTPEIVEILERVLVLQPDHALANHLYVHAMEASNDPSRANRAADRLREMVPGSSHLVHMPAHIDARVGRYEAASRANERAIAVDVKHANRTGKAGFYRVYMAHNVHFLTFASMMEGRREKALEAARALASGFTPEFLERMGPYIDGFMPVVLEVQMRFGMWDEILREPEFPALFGVSNAVRHHARCVAFTVKDRFAEAHAELAQLEALAAAMDDRPIGNNPAKLVLRIPVLLAKGELAFREGRRDEGLDLVRQAVAVEDELKYDEPPDWIIPVRHTLGALLVTAGKYTEAEGIYREDLKRWPENGWSLQGLLRCAEARGLGRETDELRARYQRAWSRADVVLTSSCFCQATR